MPKQNVTSARKASTTGDATRRSDSDLKILYVIDDLFPGLGGAERQAIKLAQALKQRGTNVEYLAPNVVKGSYIKPELDGIPIRFIDYPRVKYLGALVLMWRFASFLIQHRHDYDYMHIHITHLLTTTAGLVRPFCKIPIITKISGYSEFEGGILDQRQRLNPANLIMRLAMRNVDYVQAISTETHEKLLEAGIGKDRIALIPNGIDTSEPACPDLPSTGFVIGYCGRLRRVKGVHVLLDGFAKCLKQKKNSGLRLALAGIGSYESELRQQVKMLSIEDKVDFHGMVSDTRSFYSSLDLYVQPSFTEGLPNSVIEAMHAARAVVATDIGGNRDLVEDGVTGHFFEAGDSDKLGDLLVECFDNQQNNIRMGNNGRKLIEEKFGIESVVDQLTKIYRS